MIREGKSGRERPDLVVGQRAEVADDLGAHMARLKIVRVGRDPRLLQLQQLLPAHLHLIRYVVHGRSFAADYPTNFPATLHSLSGEFNETCALRGKM